MNKTVCFYLHKMVIKMAVLRQKVYQCWSGTWSRTMEYAKGPWENSRDMELV